MPAAVRPPFRPPFRRARPRALALLAALAALSAGAAPADPWASGYEAGYRAALQAARQAVAEGRALDSVTPPPAPPAAPEGAPAAALGAGPVTAASPAAAPAAGAAPDWWNHSSLRAPLQDDRWRHAAQLQLSGVGLSGNENGNAWRGGGQVHSRRGLWTNELALAIDKRDIRPAAGGMPNYRDYYMVQDSLRRDLSENLYVSGGFILERDNIALVQTRLTLLAGPGYYWLDNDRFRLNTFLGLGRVDERYMPYVRDHVGIEQRDSGLLYFYQTFSWKLSEQWALRQGFRFMQDLDRSGRYVFDPVASTPPGPGNPQGFERYRADSQVRRYRTVAALDFDYRLGPRSSVSFGIETRYDSNPWPDVIRRDRVRRLTLNLSF